MRLSVRRWRSCRSSFVGRTPTNVNFDSVTFRRELALRVGDSPLKAFSRTEAPSQSSTPPTPSSRPSTLPTSSSEREPFLHRVYSDEVSTKLHQLLQKHVNPDQLFRIKDSQGNEKMGMQSWMSVNLAHSVFRFDGWSSSLSNMSTDFCDTLADGRTHVGITATVKVVLQDGTYHEEIGYGRATNSEKGLAFEFARKRAVADARQRALSIFGNVLGNLFRDDPDVRVALDGTPLTVNAPVPTSSPQSPNSS